MRLNRSAVPARMWAAMALLAVSPILAGCGVTGTPVPECEGTVSEERKLEIAAIAPHDDERGLAIECWRALGRERLELWFDYPAGSGCWDLASVTLRESADAISVTLAATSARACADDAGAGHRTQIDIQAPIDDRRVLAGG